MTVVAQQVLDSAGAGDGDSAIAVSVLEEATAYVDAYIASNIVDSTVPVPDAIYDAALLACACDLFAGRKAPFGQQVGADGAVAFTRIGSDPLAEARDKLQPWCISVGFAYPADDDS